MLFPTPSALLKHKRRTAFIQGHQALSIRGPRQSANQPHESICRPSRYNAQIRFSPLREVMAILCPIQTKAPRGATTGHAISPDGRFTTSQRGGDTSNVAEATGGHIQRIANSTRYRCGRRGFVLKGLGDAQCSCDRPSSQA
jgi:hypothetical protein